MQTLLGPRTSGTSPCLWLQDYGHRGRAFEPKHVGFAWRCMALLLWEHLEVLVVPAIAPVMDWGAGLQPSI